MALIVTGTLGTAKHIHRAANSTSSGERVSRVDACSQGKRHIAQWATIAEKYQSDIGTYTQS